MTSLREYYTSKLSGDGLDIGALHKKMITHPGMNVKYVDRLTVEEMRKHYPELSEMNLQEPDILCNAQYLDGVDSNSQDFVVASHVMEHMSSPLRALQNWHTVCKSGGKIYLVVPDYRHIFDRHRPPTTLDHIIQDYREPSDERDWQHYLEYAELVDGCKGDDIIKHATEMKETGYSLHYHCWAPNTFFDFLEYFTHNIGRLSAIEGPGIAKEDPHEFHFLLTVKKD